MFDYNPFRDFKEMMKKKRLSEEDHNMGFGAGAADDYDSAQEHGKFVKEISDTLYGHGSTGEHLQYIQANPNVHSSLTSDHLHDILDHIGEERDNAKENPGTPFNPIHRQLIDVVLKHPNANEKHSKKVADMEYSESTESSPSGRGYNPVGYYPR